MRKNMKNAVKTVTITNEALAQSIVDGAVSICGIKVASIPTELLEVDETYQRDTHDVQELIPFDKKKCGFISFFPYKKEKYIEAIKGNDLERAVAMYIMFLIHIGKIDLEDYQYDFEDDIQEEVNKNGWQYMEEDDEY